MSDPIRVAEAGDPMELQLLQGLLESAGVPVQVRATGLKALQGAMGGAASLPGVFELLVEPSDAEFARALLAAEPDMDDDESSQPQRPRSE